MKLAIMQPYFFPYIGYFQLLKLVDVFVIYDDVNFIKGGWITRNQLTFNNRTCFFGIQAKNPSSFKKINEIEVADNNTRNLEKLRTSITFNYKKTPFYQDVAPIIWEVLNQEFEYVSQFAIYSIKIVSEYLGIKTKIVDTSSIYNNSDLSGQERVISICQREQAFQYINAVGGLSLYSKEDFMKNKINLTFLKPNLTTYKQNSEPFVPWLSIIDIMMYNSKEEIDKMLNQYDLF